MSLCTADYVILSASGIAGVVGLFIGFSGALAFLAATGVSSLAGKLAWTLGADYFANNWARGLAALVVTILAFGLVRWGVRRTVNGLLRQPADSIFGFLVAAVTGGAITMLAVYLAGHFEICEIESVFVSEAMSLV